MNNDRNRSRRHYRRGAAHSVRGSRASGENWKKNDYDFIIVSSQFQGMHWLDRISRVVRLWDSLSDIDTLPYTPAEFQQKSKTSSLVKNALQYGISLGR